MISLLMLLPFFLICFVQVESFSVSSSTTVHRSMLNKSMYRSQLHSTNGDPWGDDEASDDKSDSSLRTDKPSPATETRKDVPIDVPSPVLLASSMVLAIASTGSIFELSGGSPVMGFIPSLALSVVGIPLCLFLFYAAIRKGIVETEEDDKKFQQNNRF